MKKGRLHRSTTIVPQAFMLKGNVKCLALQVLHEDQHCVWQACNMASELAQSTYLMQLMRWWCRDGALEGRFQRMWARQKRSHDRAIMLFFLAMFAMRELRIFSAVGVRNLLGSSDGHQPAPQPSCPVLTYICICILFCQQCSPSCTNSC